jgi:hypothetical protein
MKPRLAFAATGDDVPKLAAMLREAAALRGLTPNGLATHILRQQVPKVLRDARRTAAERAARKESAA